MMFAPTQGPSRSPWSRRWHLWLVGIALIQPGISHALPNFAEIKADYRPSDTLILDRDGELLQRIRTDATVRRGQWVGVDEVSPALRTALVLSEDKRFYEHSGVDWRAVSAAAWGNLWNTRTRGASTISMQLAGLMDEDWRAGKGGRSVVQKIGQTVSAQVLEQRWRKDQILEAYLNLVPFRGEIVGIDALSRTLFGKAPHGLDEREAAVAAALVRAPNARVAQVAQRACGVLAAMQATTPVPVKSPQKATVQSSAKTASAMAAPTAATKVDCEGIDMFVAGALQRREFDASEGIAPHVGRRLIALRAPSPQPSPAGGRGSQAGIIAGHAPDGAVSAPGSATGSVSVAQTGAAGFPPRDIRSSLRAPLQRFAVQTLQQQLRELRGRHVEDGAIVVLDNATGEVLAWVGSSGELSRAGQVDNVLALRQPGSTLKPFLYAQAIAEKRITAASLLEDSSSQIPTASGLYIPQNYDRQFKGLVSTRTALGASLNVPAVRTLVMVSPDAFQKQLRAVGLPLKESGDYYGYSLALGSSEVPLLHLANAYRTLANGGRFSETTMLPRGNAASPGAPPLAKAKALTASTAPPVTFTPALDARAAFIATDIMADPLARARTFGTDSILATRFWTAVKTGTSKDMRDNWAMGFSQRYTVGVWVGNASGAPMWDVSGTSGAAPVWTAVMGFLHRHEPSRAPVPPAGLVQAAVRFDEPVDGRPGGFVEAPRREWFIAGTEQPSFASGQPARPSAPGRRGAGEVAWAEAAPRITAPSNGTIVALDPDIPPNRQRLSFTAEGPALRWRLDGKDFGRGASVQWLPWPGRHVVQLVDAGGKVADEIRIEVRGAGVKEARGGAAVRMR